MIAAGEDQVGLLADAANARYSADTLPRGDRMASALRLASFDSRVK
jgi:hypothetical protein